VALDVALGGSKHGGAWKSGEVARASSGGNGGRILSELGIVEERIRRRIEFHRGRLREIGLSLQKEMTAPFWSRDIRVLLLLRREQSKHARLARELDYLLQPEDECHQC
jgi:hypothetical protein